MSPLPSDNVYIVCITPFPYVVFPTNFALSFSGADLYPALVPGTVLFRPGRRDPPFLRALGSGDEGTSYEDHAIFAVLFRLGSSFNSYSAAPLGRAVLFDGIGALRQISDGALRAFIGAGRTGTVNEINKTGVPDRNARFFMQGRKTKRRK